MCWSQHLQLLILASLCLQVHSGEAEELKRQLADQAATCAGKQVQVDNLQQHVREATRQATTRQQELTAAEAAHNHAAQVTCDFTPVFFITGVACAMVLLRYA